MRRMHTLVGIALLAVLAAPAVGASFDEWLPESTIAYVSIENVSGMQTSFETGPLGALWAEAEVQAFLELPRKMLEEKLLEASENLGGARPDEMLKMLDGQIAFAFTGLRKTENGERRPGLVFLADIGENGQKVREWFSRVEKSESFREKFRLIEDEFRGVRIVTYVEETEGDDASDDAADVKDVVAGPPCYFIDGGVLAFAIDPELLKGMLDRSKAEDAPSLAGSENYRTVRRRTGPNADLVGYISVTEAMKVAYAEMDDEKTVNKARDIISALGLDTVKALGMRMSIGTEETSTSMFVYAPGEKTGVLKLLGAQNTALVPPSFVPADVASGLTMALDFQEWSRKPSRWRRSRSGSTSRRT
jgi:hypothetical protein